MDRNGAIVPNAENPEVSKAENEGNAIEHAADRLKEKFSDVPPEVIDEKVAEVHHQFDGAPVRDYVPVIVEHEVRAQLRDEAHTQGSAQEAE